MYFCGSEDHLAVKAIEETTVDGKAAIVTAAADNLFNDAQNHFARTYSHYIEKPQANVYYDFAVGQCHPANPSGDLGSFMLVTQTVNHILRPNLPVSCYDDKRYAIYDLEYPCHQWRNNQEYQL